MTSSGATPTVATSLPADSTLRATRFRWVVLAVVALTYMVGAADRANLAVALPFIKKDFHLTNAQLGTAASVFFVGVTIIQIPGGLLIQKIRLRAVMIGAIVLTSIATFLTGVANNASHLIAARTLLGVAEGPLPIGGLTMLNRWFPPQERATAVGIFVASFKVAPAIVPPIAAFIIYYMGWREVFYLFALPGILLVVLWFLVADDPRRSRRTNAAELSHIEGGETPAIAKKKGADTHYPFLDRIIRTRFREPLATNGQVARSPNIWGCALAYLLMAGPNYAILTWVPTYLVEVKGFDIVKVAVLSSAPWVGAVLGSIFGGWLSDNIFGQRRKPVMMITATSTIFTTYGLTLAPNDPTILGMLLGATGFLLSIGYSTFPVYPMGIASKDRVPFAIAIVSAGGALGAGIGPVVVGFILDHAGWNMSFAYLSACSLGALLILATIIEPRASIPASPAANA